MISPIDRTLLHFVITINIPMQFVNRCIWMSICKSNFDSPTTFCKSKYSYKMNIYFIQFIRIWILIFIMVSKSIFFSYSNYVYLHLNHTIHEKFNFPMGYVCNFHRIPTHYIKTIIVYCWVYAHFMPKVRWAKMNAQMKYCMTKVHMHFSFCFLMQGNTSSVHVLSFVMC